MAPAVSAGIASALAFASASRPRSSVALAAEMTGRGLETVTPVACGSVSGALRITLASEVDAPWAWALVSGALSTTFGAGAAGIGEMWRRTRTISWLAPVSSTIGWPMIGPLLVGALV